MRTKQSLKLKLKFSGSVAGAIFLIVVIGIPLGGFPALGGLLNPVGGIWNGAFAEYPAMKIVSGTGYSGTVYRDDLGIPHIFAKTFNDLGFIMGYLQATDRLFSMDMERHLIAGTMAEIMGPDYIESDEFMRVMGFERSGIQLWNKIMQDSASDPELQVITAAVESYCAGVNQYINEVSPLHLPFEYAYLGITPAPWTTYDVMALLKYQTYSLGFSAGDILMTIIKNGLGVGNASEIRPSTPYKFETPVIPDFKTNASGGSPKALTALTNAPGKAIASRDPVLSPASYKDLASLLGLFQAADAAGPRNDIVQACSNNWVINGSLSYSGYPILCNDPHLPLVLPPIWWEFEFVNTSNPDDCVYGVSFPGTPIAEIGHTTKIAWGCTVSACDQDDFYAEKLNKAGTQYLFNNTQWRNIETDPETIKVKGGQDVPFNIKFTRHDLDPQDDYQCPIITDSSIFGPMFSGLTDISIKWTGYAADYGILKTFFRLDTAHGINDYVNAISVYNAPGMNFVYADVDGNIALYPEGKYPVRNATGTIRSGEYILNGSNGMDEWTGYIPFDWVPHKINPQTQMYLASANQRTVNTSEYTRYYITQNDFDISYRSRRINEFLQNESISHVQHGTTITIPEMKQYQNSYYDIGAEVFVPYLLSAFKSQYPRGVPGTGNTALLNKSITALLEWNESTERWVMDKNLIAPTIFDTWLNNYTYDTIGDEFTKANIPVTSSVLYVCTDFIENLTRYGQNSPWFNDVLTGTTKNATIVMLDALNQTIARLQSDLGDFTNWEWSNYHQMDIEYLMGAIPAFNIPKYACSGSARTINVAQGPDVQEGPSMRMIIDLASLANGSLYSGYLTVMGGQSGNPASSHYDDNFLLWKNNTYHPILFPRTMSAYPKSEIYSEVAFS